MKGNKKLIIIISIFFSLIIVGGVFAYLFTMTDIFKSNQELFAKYFTQNAQVLENLTNFQTHNVYKNLNNSKYESSTLIKTTHSEGGEISNPLNNLSAKLNIQNDNDKQYTYVDGQILYEDEEYLEAEIIKEQELYGIRFTDALKQFITVKNDEKAENVVNDIGISYEQLQMFVNVLDGIEQTTVEEEILGLKSKYLNIMTTTISNGTFSKQKNAMITYNNITTKTNSYSVLLTSQQVENMLLEILNNIKTENQILEKLQTIINKDEVTKCIDELINKINEEIEVPTIKITVYEKKQKTIRTGIEVEGYRIEIENIEQNGEIKSTINYTDLNNEQVTQYKAEIIKKNIENQENMNISINATEGENIYTISLLSEMKLSEKQIKLDVEISHKQDITTTSIILENEVKVGSDFENTESLAPGEYIVLNNIQDSKRKELIDILKQLVPQKTKQRIDLLKEKFGIKEEQPNIEGNQESEMSQIDVNKFNSKFEFYTGDKVSAENVKALLNIVKNNLKGYEITEDETQSDNDNTEQTVKQTSIKLNIENGIINDESTNKILEKINDSKFYKVLIFYKTSNGLIDYITITEI